MKNIYAALFQYDLHLKLLTAQMTRHGSLPTLPIYRSHLDINTNFQMTSMTSARLIKNSTPRVLQTDLDVFSEAWRPKWLSGLGQPWKAEPRIPRSPP